MKQLVKLWQYPSQMCWEILPNLETKACWISLFRLKCAKFNDAPRESRKEIKSTFWQSANNAAYGVIGACSATLYGKKKFSRTTIHKFSLRTGTKNCMARGNKIKSFVYSSTWRNFVCMTFNLILFFFSYIFCHTPLSMLRFSGIYLKKAIYTVTRVPLFVYSLLFGIKYRRNPAFFSEFNYAYPKSRNNYCQEKLSNKSREFPFSFFFSDQGWKKK